MKKEYLKRLKLVSSTEFNAQNKIQQLVHWQYWHFYTVLELLTGAKKTAKTRQENEKTANHPWTASPKDRCRSLVCSQKSGGRGLMQLEEAYTIEITNLVEYVDKGRSANTDCQRHQHKSTQ